MAEIWKDIPFFWGFVALSVLAILFGLRAWFLAKKLPEEARQEWQYQVSENMQDLRLTEDAFVRAYTKVHAPRGWKLAAMALATFMVLAVPAFALIQFLLYKVWRDNLNEVSKMPQFRGRLEVLSDPVLLWQFGIFGSAIAFCVLVVGLFVRQYYKSAPGFMRDELIFERAGFMPKTKLTIGPNPAHLDADDFASHKLSGREVLSKIFTNVLGLEKRTEENWNNSGHICDIYSDGSEMQICVHVSADADGFSATTHPFFFPGEFARHDDKPRIYSVIMLVSNAYGAFEKIKSTGIEMDNVSASQSSRHCDFTSGALEMFIYDARG